MPGQKRKIKRTGPLPPSKKAKTAPKKKASTKRKLPPDFYGQVYPFAKDTCPRFLDGVVNRSVSSIYCTFNKFTVTSANGGHILLYPGLTSGLIYSDGLAVAGTYTNFQYPNSEEVYLSDATASGAAGQNRVDTVSTIAKWRIVSCGIRLLNLNSSDTTDGYLEIVRTNHKLEAADWVEEVDGTNTAALAPLGLLAFLDQEEITNDSSYKTVAVKDCDKYEASLCPMSNPVPFIDVRTGMKYTSTTFVAGSPDYYNCATGDQDFQEIIQTYIQTNFDNIYIRCNKGTNNMNFLIETSVNFEFVFAPQSSFSRYMQESDLNKTQEKMTADRMEHSSSVSLRPPSDEMNRSRGATKTTMIPMDL